MNNSLECQENVKLENVPMSDDDWSRIIIEYVESLWKA